MRQELCYTLWIDSGNLRNGGDSDKMNTKIANNVGKNATATGFGLRLGLERFVKRRLFTLRFANSYTKPRSIMVTFLSSKIGVPSSISRIGHSS